MYNTYVNIYIYIFIHTYACINRAPKVPAASFRQPTATSVGKYAPEYGKKGEKKTKTKLECIPMWHKSRPKTLAFRYGQLMAVAFRCVAFVRSLKGWLVAWPTGWRVENTNRNRKKVASVLSIVYLHIYIQTFIHLYIHTFIHSYIHTYVYEVF